MPTQSYGGSGLFGQPVFGYYRGVSELPQTVVSSGQAVPTAEAISTYDVPERAASDVVNPPADDFKPEQVFTKSPPLNLSYFMPSDLRNNEMQNQRPLTIDPRFDAPAAASASSSVVAGMFPEVEAMQRALYQQKQNEAMQAQAMQFARLSPMERAQYSLYMGGQQLGGAIGSALGAKDPQLQLISMRNSIMSQLDQNNPETFFKAARMAYQYGDSDFATKIADAGQKLQVSAATTRKTIAEAEKFELSNTQEQKLRDELAKLPATATEADILAVVTKYGSPDKVLAVLQSSTDRAAQRDARAAEKLKDIEYKRDRDLQNAKNDKERAQIAADAKLEIAQLMADSKESMGRLAASLKQPPAPSVTTIVDPTNPNQMISIDTRQYKTGGVGSPGVIGVSGKEPTAAIRENKVEAGKSELQDQLSVLREAFTTLNEKRAIPSTERNPVSNVLSSIQGSGVGQVAGRAIGSKEQVERDVINSAKQRLVQSIKNATGMSSQQLNSNFELKTMLNSLSDVNLGYEASMRIIDDLENAYVGGVGMGKSGMSTEDKQALQWANSNPNDPRSAQIKQRLGVK